MRIRMIINKTRSVSIRNVLIPFEDT